MIETPAIDTRQPTVEDRQPTIDVRQPTVGDQQPTIDMRQPTVDGQQPTIDMRQPTVGDQQPIADVRQPTVEDRQLTADMRQPTVEDRQPIAEDALRYSASLREKPAMLQPTGSVPGEEGAVPVIENPAIDTRQPTIDTRQPTIDARQPTIDARQPIADIRQPTFEGDLSDSASLREMPAMSQPTESVPTEIPHETGSVPAPSDARPGARDPQPTGSVPGGETTTIDTRQPTIGGQQPTIDMRQPTVGDRQPTIDMRQPTVGDQQPTIDMRQPAVEGILRASASPRETAPIAQPTGSVPEVEEEQKVVQAADVRMPTAVDVQMPVGTAQAVDPAASARTVDIVETVEKIVAAVSEQIEVVPSLEKGEETVIIHLKPDVLGGSDISMSAKDGVLTLEIAPATPETAALAEKHVPQLERALAEHVTTFHGFAVVVKKGKSDETK